MNKKVTLLVSLCMLMMAFTVSVSAQDEVDKFIGEWTLDEDKSELGQQTRVETVVAKMGYAEIRGRSLLQVTKTSLRDKREGDRGVRGRFGRGAGGQIDGKNVETMNYDLDGKESESTVNRGRAAGKTKSTLSFNKDGSMTINQKTEIDSPRGLIKLKKTETWVLSTDGTTLTISSEMDTPRGKRNSTMVFNKSAIKVLGNSNTTSVDTPAIDKNIVPKRINGGVINGKAKSLPRPDYSEAARMGGLRGTVKVQVIIDTDGNVINAKALSGHPVLRQASVDSARNAKFQPTLLDGKRVEVQGVIIYKYQ